MSAKTGVLAFRQTSPLTAEQEAILLEHERANDRMLEEGMARVDAESDSLRTVVGFTGNVSLVQIGEIAAGLERDGRRVCVRWLRDIRGVIDGVAICQINEP